MTEERALGEAVETAPTQIVDTTVTPTPEDFDLDAWIGGVRPTRRSVRLLANAHLIEQLERIAADIDQADDEDDVDDLIDEYERLRDQINNGVWFTLERRSNEWVAEFRREVSRKLNLKLKVDDNGDLDDDTGAAKVNTVLAHQLAAQIVEPAGVTAAHIDALREQSTEYAKLLAALLDVNQRLAESAGVMTRDFSHRRSGKNATQES